MVSVVFINLELGIKNEGEKKLSVLQNVFEAIYMSVVKFEGESLTIHLMEQKLISILFTGSLNKVFAFDKVTIPYYHFQSYTFLNCRAALFFVFSALPKQCTRQGLCVPQRKCSTLWTHLTLSE